MTDKDLCEHLNGELAKCAFTLSYILIRFSYPQDIGR